MSSPRVVLLESDDLMHPNTGETNFNESAYYNFFDPRCGLGGFVRLGNRPNEGHAEMTVCLYLPGGGAAFMYARPEIAGNDRFAAGGLSFDVCAPFREHAIRYTGNTCQLARPLDLFDPRRAFSENPHGPTSIDLRWEGLSPGFGGERRVEHEDGWRSAPVERAGQEFARGHLEQHGHVTGRVAVDGTEWTVDGHGLRDHSWGPRYWQAPRCYRWLTMNFGPDAGIAAALTVQRDGGEMHGGYVWRRGEPNRRLARVVVETEYGAERLHERLGATFHPVDGPPLRVEGRVLAMVPLRNRRAGLTTRIAEGLTEWRWDGRTGYGWSEYLDHLD